MPQRLSNQIIDQVTQVAKPAYSRENLDVAIVHLGIGAFHRAHQAVYTDEVNNKEGGRWGIVGCSLRSPSVQQQLQPQDGLYTVLQKGADVSARIVGCIKAVLVGPQNPQAIIDAIAAPTARILSLTITEKGYCHFPATGELNPQHPDIVADLADPERPRSAIGFIVAGLNARRKKQLGPITVLSCDNLPHNGKVVQKVVTGFAALVDPVLAQWIEQHVTFPSTMVDRIVPATTAEDTQLCEQQFGYQDEGLVVAEPFSQWVVENRFCHGRPNWESVGALLVDDVDAYETMKLRLLNGSHSLLAYAGYLAGCETVYQAMQNPKLQALCKRFMAGAATTLATPQTFDLGHYQAQLIERFSNPSLKHKTWQIAMDGSQKIPQRWLNSLRHVIKQQGDISLFAFALAAWIRFTKGEDEQGQMITVSDPLAAQFAELWQNHHKKLPDLVTAFFAQKSIFDDDLPECPVLVNTVTLHLQNLLQKGIKEVMTGL